jgi:beta propeller repeat protein
MNEGFFVYRPSLALGEGFTIHQRRHISNRPIERIRSVMNTSTASPSADSLRSILRLRTVLVSAVIVGAFALAGCDGGGSSSPEPIIRDLQPESGPPGTMVTINGAEFGSDSADVSVTFGGIPASVERVTPTLIETNVPSGVSIGSVPVEVTVKGETADGPSFMVERAAPGITAVVPDSGTVGTTVTIEGMNFSASASGNTVTFDGTPAPINGAATDQLKTEVPAGATDGPIKVTVDQKSTQGPDFDVITEGTAAIATSTGGVDKDSDGYTVTIDGAQQRSAGPSDTTYVPGLEKGSHVVELTGTAGNCSLQGGPSRSITISAGDTTTVPFNVTCDGVATNRIVFTSDREGNFDIHITNPDGSSTTQLTTNPADEFNPDISPDGSTIVFASGRTGDRDIYTMDVSEGTVTRLTDDPAQDANPAWSPDGTEIAFVSRRGDGTRDVYKMKADGSDVQALATTGSSGAPDWSPDGTKIVFEYDPGDTGADEITTMNPDGSGKNQLTSTAINRDPSWSPDGSKIAFRSSRDGNGDDIYTINPDGTGLTEILDNNVRDADPTWSPDGSQLAINSELADRVGDREIFTISRVGSNITNVTNDPSTDVHPVWGPGRQ